MNPAARRQHKITLHIHPLPGSHNLSIIAVAMAATMPSSNSALTSGSELSQPMRLSFLAVVILLSIAIVVSICVTIVKHRRQLRNKARKREQDMALRQWPALKQPTSMRIHTCGPLAYDGTSDAMCKAWEYRCSVYVETEGITLPEKVKTWPASITTADSSIYGDTLLRYHS